MSYSILVKQVFTKFFDVFAKFFDVFGPVRTCFYAFGYVRMHSDAFGKKKNQKKKLKNFDFFFQKFREVFRCFREVSGELEANGPQNQLEHQILLQIHLS